MTAEIRSCPEHGPFDGPACPVCEAAGERVISASRRKRLSKFVSGALRHFPEDAGIELDGAGWTDRDALVRQIGGKYDWFDPAMLDAVVATDPKGRFEVDDGRIRAAYGHSVDVELASGDSPVPDALYHGTAPRNLEAILAEGLKPMDRKRVHLTDTIAEARAVGERHAAEPVLLRVDAEGLTREGCDVTKRGKHVYTAARVPPRFLEVVDGT